MSRKKIFIAGHRGLVGSAMTRLLEQKEDWEVHTRTRKELDLTDSIATKAFLKELKPDYVYVAAAHVGGIKANNDFPVEFLLNNLRIQNALMEGAYEAGVKKLLFLGSSCIYPKFSKQPITEDQLLTGILEPTNEAYAIAKITGIKLCQAYRREYGQNFIAAMPTNMYGPNDNYHPENSHVLPGLIHKFHVAKHKKADHITLWGTGTPRREFLHSDDLARASLLLFEKYDSPDIINVGTGEDVTIKELAETIQSTIGFEGEIQWDSSHPDGTLRKLLDVSKLKGLGWEPQVSLSDGIQEAYDWYLEHIAPNLSS